jgi:hypothetical protein
VSIGCLKGLERPKDRDREMVKDREESFLYLFFVTFLFFLLNF